MTPPRPQQVLDSTTEAAIFLVLTVREGGEDTARDLLADLADLTKSVGFRDRDGDLRCVVGVGSDAYDRMFGGPRPAVLHPFRALDGGRHQAPSTPGDLLFHVRARKMDLCFELAGQLMTRLRGVVRVEDETHGFRFFDERDLMGFVDGTANPTGDEALAAVLIGTEDPGFAGGSYVTVQKYLHDLDTWNAISVEEQERVIGRTKLTDIEMSDDVKPSNSHVALTTILDEDGEEREVVRDNMPFGSVGGGADGAGENGTYFIGYSAAPELIETMLTNMFVGNPPGNTDRILDFSTAITGTLFFVPSADFLDDLPDPPGSPEPDPPESPASADPSPGSLGIGSLNRRDP